jgi:hypothetical protein
MMARVSTKDYIVYDVYKGSKTQMFCLLVLEGSIMVISSGDEVEGAIRMGHRGLPGGPLGPISWCEWHLCGMKLG